MTPHPKLARIAPPGVGFRAKNAVGGVVRLTPQPKLARSATPAVGFRAQNAVGGVR